VKVGMLFALLPSIIDELGWGAIAPQPFFLAVFMGGC